MALWREVAHRFSYLLGRGRFDRQLQDEMRFHVECRADELEQSGMSRKDALAAARREFGSPARASEDARDAWQFRWLEELLSDLRYAARAFRRNPAFAFTGILCLTLGIGANTLLFSITTGLLFNQPSSRDAATLAAIRIGGNSHAPVSDYRFLREAKLFDDLAGINPESQMNWRNGDQNRSLWTTTVTSNFFTMTGVPLAFGRGIAEGEKDTVVLSNGLWRTRLGSDPAVLGRSLLLDGRHFTVVGVLPDNHRTIIGIGFSPDLYVPVQKDDDMLMLYSRLPRDMSLAQARSRLQGACRELDRLHPAGGGWKRTNEISVSGVTGIEAFGREMLMPIYAFFAMVMFVAGLVLLIACANVASLLLARASSRSQELAIRLSLGARRSRIVRHLLAESLLLAALGTAAGLLIDIAGSAMLGRYRLPLPVPIQLVIEPDVPLLIYSICLALITVLAAGLLPAFKAVRGGASATLKQDEHQTGRVWNLRAALVGGQIAVSVVLLATGFLFLHNLIRATTMNPGFDVDRTLWASMRLVPESYKDQRKQELLVQSALERLESLPGVESATAARSVPLNDSIMRGEDMRTDVGKQSRNTMFQYNRVSPGYFRTMGIPILHGREFAYADGQGSPVILNQAFAALAFGTVDPVGHTMWAGNNAPLLVVGVVKNSKYLTLGERDRPALYEPYFGAAEPVNVNFLIRSAASPASLARTVNATLMQLDGSAAVETKPMSGALGLALLPSRAGAAMLGSIGILGLVLASIGLYGILLYAVVRRTREIGLRVALGATPAQVIRLVFGQSLGMVAAGTAAGLALAWLATRPLALFLVPGLSPADPVSFAAVVGVLGAVSVVAAAAPAIRALRVDPMVALRYE
jgi:predicted permease